MLNMASNKTSYNSPDIDITHTLSGHSDLLQKENVKIPPSPIKVSVLCMLTRCRVLKIAILVTGIFQPILSKNF